MRNILLQAAILGAALTGCSKLPPAEADHGRQQMWIGDTLRSASIKAAVVRQGTIFPYHFVDGTSSLNPLGVRDLGYLTDHLADHGGVLRLARGSTSIGLYAKRTAAITNALYAAGLEEEQFTLTDGAPGGDGMPGQRAFEISQPQENATAGFEKTVLEAFRDQN